MDEHRDHRHGSLDEKGRRKLRARLSRIEGQIRGIARMVEEDRYCPDILLQIAAANASLRSTARVLLDSHVRHCVTDAIRSRNPKRSEEVYEELSELFGKFAN
jgi:CsoR family transcriptional regulator, copper-sensing transcriptional repressor